MITEELSIYLTKEPVNKDEARFIEHLKRSYDELVKTLKAHNGGVLMNVKVRSMKDERVCSNCIKHNMYIVSVDKAIIGENIAPFHEGCRCLNIYEIADIK